VLGSAAATIAGLGLRDRASVDRSRFPDASDTTMMTRVSGCFAIASVDRTTACTSDLVVVMT
jgi:hypothetical protein